MSEVFRGTPAIVSVTIGDQEGKQSTYHVAGQDMGAVEEAVNAALKGLPEEGSPAGKPKKARKKRSTKVEMAAKAELQESESPVDPILSARKNKKEPAWLAT